MHVLTPDVPGTADALRPRLAARGRRLAESAKSDADPSQEAVPYAPHKQHREETPSEREGRSGWRDPEAMSSETQAALLELLSEPEGDEQEIIEYYQRLSESSQYYD